jgi:hypothetical protein
MRVIDKGIEEPINVIPGDSAYEPGRDTAMTKNLDRWN